MPKKESDKCRYRSIKGGGWLSASQMLAERMCLRLAKYKNKEIGHLFWQEKSWEKQFRFQVTKAAKLLKEFSFEAIFKTLRSKKGKGIYSLAAPFLPELIEEEQSLLDAQIEARKSSVSPTPKDKIAHNPRPNFSFKQSTASRLKDL